MAKRKPAVKPGTDIDLSHLAITLELPEPEPRRNHQVQIRLDDDNMALLRELASQRGTTPTTLARQIVEALLEAVRHQLAKA